MLYTRFYGISLGELGQSELVSSAMIGQVRLVSIKAERPNHPSHYHARQGGSGGGGGGGGGGGVLHNNDNDNDDTYMTPWGWFDLQSRLA